MRTDFSLTRLLDKDERIAALMTELNLLKEFKNKRAQLEKDFDQMKEAAEQAQQAHAEKIKRMEVYTVRHIDSGIVTVSCVRRGSWRRRFGCRKRPTGRSRSSRKRPTQTR